MSYLEAYFSCFKDGDFLFILLYWFSLIHRSWRSLVCMISSPRCAFRVALWPSMGIVLRPFFVLGQEGSKLCRRPVFWLCLLAFSWLIVFLRLASLIPLPLDYVSSVLRGAGLSLGGSTCVSKFKVLDVWRLRYLGSSCPALLGLLS